MANISKINFKGVEYNIKPLMDTEPTANSTNAVQSGGVKSALDGLLAEIPTVDAVPTHGSNNAVRSGGVYESLAGIQDDIDDLKGGLQDIEDDIEEIYIGKAIVVTETVNKINPNEITSGVLVDNHGEETDDSRYWASGYIPLTTDKTSIAFTGTNAGGTARACLPISRILFYDANKVVLEYADNVPSNTITAIPNNAVFARINPRDTYYPRQPMVEFVDAIGEISSTFVAYEEVQERSLGLDGINQKLSEIDSSLSDLEDETAEFNAVASQVETNTEKINNAYGVPFPVSKIGTFVRGYIRSTDGEINTNQNYKVASPDNLVASIAYNMTVADGFRVYLYVFGDASIDLHKKWHTGTIEIEKGTVFRMTISRVTEDTSEIADIDVFCSKVMLSVKDNVNYFSEEIEKIDAITLYGATWDWWISSNSVDEFGNAYIGYVDTNAYHGVLRRQPDGVMQYKRLERAENTDDHNGTATIVLDDGRILAIGAYGHSKDEHIVCWRSTKPYSIDVMEKCSFDIPQTDGGWKYACTYSQIFKYNGKLFDFLRCVATKTGETTATGYLCLMSEDDGETWTAYKFMSGSDPYITFCETDDSKIIKGVAGKNPASGIDMLRGFTFDMSTLETYDLTGTKIGQLVALNSGTVDDINIAHSSDMTEIISQGSASNRARLFTVAKTSENSTVFLYAVAVDSAMSDFIYKLYDGSNSIDVGHSGTAFGNNHYISGACFGKDINTVYYSKATTSKADGAHELHKVKIANGAVESDEIITEASMCILRPLFLGNGELAVAVGHYNDQNDDGTYNRSFTAWKLKPLFTRA